jgi:hypothetical protein
VLGYARDDTAAEECRLAVEDAGARCLVVRADVADPAGVEHLFARAEEHGRLTGVVDPARGVVLAGLQQGAWPEQAADVVGAEGRGVTEHGFLLELIVVVLPPWHAGGGGAGLLRRARL